MKKKKRHRRRKSHSTSGHYIVEIVGADGRMKTKLASCETIRKATSAMSKAKRLFPKAHIRVENR